MENKALIVSQKDSLEQHLSVILLSAEIQFAM